MTNVEKISVNQIRPIVTPGTFKKTPEVSKKESFQAILDQVQGVKFSAHAKQRMIERGISIDASNLAMLNRAVEKAREKGANNALILMENSAFIANVRNQIVITATDKENLRENVFTNIDSAIVL